MPTKICPHCNKRYIADAHTIDFNHECNSGNPALDQEDVVVIGDWSDYAGDGVGQNVLTQGAENVLFGTRADIEGKDDENKTRRGLRSSTHRQRQHIQHIELKGGDCE